MILSLNHLDTALTYYLEILLSLQLFYFIILLVCFLLFPVFLFFIWTDAYRGLQSDKSGCSLCPVAGVASMHPLRCFQAAVPAAESANLFPFLISEVPLAWDGHDSYFFRYLSNLFLFHLIFCCLMMWKILILSITFQLDDISEGLTAQKLSAKNQKWGRFKRYTYKSCEWRIKF